MPASWAAWSYPAHGVLVVWDTHWSTGPLVDGGLRGQVWQQLDRLGVGTICEDEFEAALSLLFHVSTLNPLSTLEYQVYLHRVPSTVMWIRQQPSVRCSTVQCRCHPGVWCTLCGSMRP